MPTPLSRAKTQTTKPQKLLFGLSVDKPEDLVVDVILPRGGGNELEELAKLKGVILPIELDLPYHEDGQVARVQGGLDVESLHIVDDFAEAG